MVIKYYKKKKKSFEKKHVKDTKIFQKRKKTKGKKTCETDIKIFLQYKSRNFLSILAHKK